MGFWLKKTVSFWLMPLPLCLAVLTIGALLLWTTRRARLGRWLVAVAAALLLTLSNRIVSTWLVRPIEAAYPPVPELIAGQPLPSDLAACRYVVVLGGGHGDVAAFSAVNQLSSAARGRLAEGLRLWRALPGAKLVVSGRGAPNQPSHAAVLATAAISLGADPTRIVRLDTPRDTEEEATALSGLIGRTPFALVTSATHLRRATALMRRAGLHPLPCPSDYTSREEDFRWADCLWDVESLGRSTWAVYERLGYAWSWLRGRV